MTTTDLSSPRGETGVARLGHLIEEWRGRSG